MNKLLLDEARREQSSGSKQAAPAERLAPHAVSRRYREFAFACLTVEKNEMCAGRPRAAAAAAAAAAIVVD